MPTRDEVCRHARATAHRYKTLGELAVAVNGAMGTNITPSGLRNQYRRWREVSGEPALVGLLGTGAKLLTDYIAEDGRRLVEERIASDFDDEPTRPGASASPAAFAASVVADSATTDPLVGHMQSCIQWGTSLERQCVEAFAQFGSLAEAAESMGMTVRLLRGIFSDLERRAASRGWSPGNAMTKTVPDGFHVKGVSTYYDADGNLKGQWVKSNKDQENRLEQMLEAIQVIAEPFRGEADPAIVPKVEDDDLLAVIPFGDPHFGMYAWAAESGEDFDLKIAEADLCAAVDHLVGLAPPAKQALIISLGDLVHADSASGTTTAGTRVDVDTRQSKVIGVVIRAMQRCIDCGLRKFQHVTFVPVCGNHDDYTSLMLGHCLAAYYAREPRVTIDTSPDRFRWYRFGKNLIGMTHGHTVKKEQLAGIMACDRKEDWAETETRVWYTGHIHHETVKEFPGVVVESFRTLAPKDAWHHGSGYRAGRDLRLDIYHREHGRINRHIVGVRQVRAKRAGG